MILGASVQREALECGRALSAPLAPRPLVSLKSFRRASSASAAAVTELPDSIEDTATVEVRPFRRGWWKSPYDAQILTLVFPMFLANMIMPLTNAVDAAIVGRLGVAQLSGVTVASMISSFIYGSLGFVAILTTSFVAKNHAANKPKEVSVYIARTLWFGLIIGIGLALLISTQASGLVHFVKPALEVQAHAVAYLRILALVLPCIMAFMVSSGAMRGLKDTKPIFYASLIIFGTNTLLDILFVYGFGWAVRGAALATVLSAYLGSSYLFRCLIQRGTVRLEDIFRVPDFSGLLSFLGEGSRFSARSMLFMGMLVLGSLFMAKRGAILHATFEVCRQTGLMTYLYYQSLEQAAQILAAGCIGLKDYAAARAIILRILQLGFLGTALMVTLLVVFPAQYAGIFTTNPLVIQRFSELAPWLLLPMPIASLVTIVDGVLIGASKTKLVTTTQCVVFAICIALLVALHRSNTLNLFNAWIVLRLGTVLSGVVTGPYLFSTRLSPYGFKRLP